MNNFNYKRQNDKKQTQDVNAQEDAGQTQTTNLPQPIVNKHSLLLQTQDHKQPETNTQDASIVRYSSKQNQKKQSSISKEKVQKGEHKVQPQNKKNEYSVDEAAILAYQKYSMRNRSEFRPNIVVKSSKKNRLSNSRY